MAQSAVPGVSSAVVSHMGLSPAKVAGSGGARGIWGAAASRGVSSHAGPWVPVTVQRKQITRTQSISNQPKRGKTRQKPACSELMEKFCLSPEENLLLSHALVCLFHLLSMCTQSQSRHLMEIKMSLHQGKSKHIPGPE